MKRYKKYIFIILLLGLPSLILFNDFNDSRIFSVQVDYNLKSDTTLPYIIIKDTGGVGLDFTFSLNNLFWFHPDSMISYIHKIPVKDSFNTKKEIIQAWQFVNSFTFHRTPLTQTDKKIHSPEIMINSIGYGFCDDRTASLCMVWEKMGYKYRIYNVIDHHVFPEVYDGKKWMMFDPDYGILLLTENNEIASIADIRSFIKLTPFKNDYKNWDPYLQINIVMAYPKLLQDIYLKADKSRINNWFADEVEWEKTSFKLPPFTKVEFPIYIDNIISPLCKITIPDYYYGTIQLPLVIHQIINADVNLLQNHKTDGVNIEAELVSGKVDVKGTDVVIYAYMNPILFLSEKEIKFKLYSYKKNLPEIKILEQQIPEGNIFFIKNKISQDIINNKDLITNLALRCSNMDMPQIKNYEDLMLASRLLLSDGAFDADTNTIYQKFSILNNYFSTDTLNLKKFYDVLNQPEYLAIILVTYEHSSIKDLIKIME